jgi:polar amino acid transport system substrate-binding protein
MPPESPRRRTLHVEVAARLSMALLGALLLAAGCAATVDSPSSTATQAARAVLAPEGVLRIAVYRGSPTSMVRRASGDGACGMSVDLGTDIARRLGVPARLVEFERVEQVVDAVRRGAGDFTITNASPARAALVDFTKPVVAIELGYLVMPGSPVASVAEVDRPGIRVGVSQGSTSQATLARTLQHAQVVPAPSLQAAAAMLTDRRVDAYATNKAILFQLADGLPGARILDGRWGVESLAMAVPKGREAGLAWLDAFAADARREGLVDRAAACAGLRGLAPPEAR